LVPVQPPIDVASLAPPVRKILDPATPAPMRQMAAKGIAPGLRPGDALTVVALLAESADEALAAAARATLDKLPAPLLNGALAGDLPPGVLAALAPRYARTPEIAEKVLAHPAMPPDAVADVASADGYDEANPDRVFAAIDGLRIPAEYLANLFTAGNAETIRVVLRKLAAVRALMRAAQLGLDPDAGLPASVGATQVDLEDLFRLLAIAKYDDRYVVPPAHAEDAGRLMYQHEQLFCSLDPRKGDGEAGGGPGMGGTGPPGSAESFHLTGGPGDRQTFRGDDGQVHFNLLGWDGKGSAPHLFPGGAS